MKRIVLAVGLAAFTVTGCVGPFGLTEQRDADKHQTHRPPAVHADQVNDANAHAQALALEAEMDFDAQSDRAPAPAKTRR